MDYVVSLFRLGRALNLAYGERVQSQFAGAIYSTSGGTNVRRKGSEFIYEAFDVVKRKNE
jgi:hypothetical protein